MKNPHTISVILASLLLLSSSGCSVVRDGVAGLIGAPTTEQVQEAAQAIEQAQAKIGELSRAADRTAKAEAEEARKAQEITAQMELVRSQIASVAQQLATAEGPAYEALSTTLDSLRASQKQLMAQGVAHTSLAARYAALLAELQGSIQANQESLETSTARLAEFDEVRAKAIADATAGVRLAADTAGQWIPGAGIAGGKVADVLGGLFTLVLGGTAVSAMAKARTASAKAKEFEHAADENYEAAASIAKSIEAARKNPEFNAAFEKVKPLLVEKQTETAIDIVAEAT
jgi:hypothetical protein